MEIEAEVRVSSHAPIRRRLRALGARSLGTAHERNLILDRAGVHRARGERGRLRASVPIDGGARRVHLTHKGPRRDASLKVRPEREIGIDDFDEAAALVEALGYERVFAYEKQRESWRLGETTIELDRVPLLGRFVEIEGRTEADVTAALRELELHDRPLVRRGYVALLRRRLRRLELSLPEVRCAPVGAAAA